MRRRDFLTGAAALGAFSWIKEAEALKGSHRAALLGKAGTPAIAPRNAQIANRTSLPEVATFSGQTWVISETNHVMEQALNGQVEIWWPNWGVAIGVETLPGAVATATAQITYTDAGTQTPVTVNLVDVTSGLTSLSAADGDYFKTKATINVAKGSRILPRIRANFPNGFPYAMWKADLLHSEKLQYATTSGGLPALNGTITPTLPATYLWYGPCLIRGTHSAPVGAIISDSRDDGIYDIPNTTSGDSGHFPRLLGQAGVAHINLSGRGESAQQYAGNTNNSRRRALVTASGANFMCIGLGVNDAGGRTGAQINTDNTSIITAAGLPAIWKTLDPQTKDGITTPATTTKTANIAAYNAIVRAKSCYFDTAIVLESGTTPGAWACWTAVWLDYLHGQNLGNKYAAANGAIVGTSVGVHGFGSRAAGPRMPEGNLLAQPTDLSNAAWTKTEATITNANTVTQALLETTVSSQHRVAASVTKTASAKMRIAFDVTFDKTRQFAAIEFYNGNFSSGGGAFFANDGTLVSAGPFGSFTIGDNFNAAQLNGNGVGMSIDITTDTDTAFQGYFMPSTDGFTKIYVGNVANGLSIRNLRMFELT